MKCHVKDIRSDISPFPEVSFQLTSIRFRQYCQFNSTASEATKLALLKTFHFYIFAIIIIIIKFKRVFLTGPPNFQFQGEKTAHNQPELMFRGIFHLWECLWLAWWLHSILILNKGYEAVENKVYYKSINCLVNLPVAKATELASMQSSFLAISNASLMKKEMRTRYHGNRHEIPRNRTCSGKFAEQPIKKDLCRDSARTDVPWVFSDVDLFEKKQFCRNGKKV